MSHVELTYVLCLAPGCKLVSRPDFQYPLNSVLGVGEPTLANGARVLLRLRLPPDPNILVEVSNDALMWALHTAIEFAILKNTVLDSLLLVPLPTQSTQLVIVNNQEEEFPVTLPALIAHDAGSIVCHLLPPSYVDATAPSIAFDMYDNVNKPLVVPRELSSNLTTVDYEQLQVRFKRRIGGKDAQNEQFWYKKLDVLNVEVDEQPAAADQPAAVDDDGGQQDVQDEDKVEGGPGEGELGEDEEAAAQVAPQPQFEPQPQYVYNATRPPAEISLKFQTVLSNLAAAAVQRAAVEQNFLLANIRVQQGNLFRELPLVVRQAEAGIGIPVSREMLSSPDIMLLHVAKKIASLWRAKDPSKIVAVSTTQYTPATAENHTRQLTMEGAINPKRTGADGLYEWRFSIASFAPQTSVGKKRTAGETEDDDIVTVSDSDSPSDDDVQFIGFVGQTGTERQKPASESQAWKNRRPVPPPRPLTDEERMANVQNLGSMSGTDGQNATGQPGLEDDDSNIGPPPL